MEFLDEIVLTGVRATGYHGVFEHERREGQEFIVDVAMQLDTRPAAVSDDVTDTVHYGEVADEVWAIIAGDPVDLVETLAQRIADAVLRRPLVHRVRVTVHKPQAPITVPFEDVRITIVRTLGDA